MRFMRMCESECELVTISFLKNNDKEIDDEGREKQRRRQQQKPTNIYIHCHSQEQG